MNKYKYMDQWFKDEFPRSILAITDQGENDLEKRDLIFIDLFKKTESKRQYVFDHNYGSIFYNINSNGFRGNDFTKEHKNKHIIFLGCSETFGDGGNIEEAWSHMLYSKISEKFQLDGFYNLGMRGIGWIDILALIPQYIKNFGDPDAIFIMFPNMERYISWIPKEEAEKSELDEGYYKMGHFDDKDIPKLNLENRKHFIRVKNKDEHMDDFAKMSLSIQLLEMYCKKQNIKLFWSSTMPSIRQTIRVKFNNLFDDFIDIDDSSESIYDMIRTDSNLTIRKADGMHAGTAHHLIWSNSLFEKFIERENNEQ